MYENEELSQANDNQVHGHIRLGAVAAPNTEQFFLGVASSLVAGLILLYFCGKDA